MRNVLKGGHFQNIPLKKLLKKRNLKVLELFGISDKSKTMRPVKLEAETFFCHVLPITCSTVHNQIQINKVQQQNFICLPAANRSNYCFIYNTLLPSNRFVSKGRAVMRQAETVKMTKTERLLGYRVRPSRPIGSQWMRVLGVYTLPRWKLTAMGQMAEVGRMATPPGDRRTHPPSVGSHSNSGCNACLPAG